MGDFEYLDECAAKWQDLPARKLTRQQQAVVDVVNALGLIEGDGVEALWAASGDSMGRIIESFTMAGATEIADRLRSTAFCKDVIARTPPGADSRAYGSPDEEEKLSDSLLFVSAKGPDAREGLLRFLPKRRG